MAPSDEIAHWLQYLPGEFPVTSEHLAVCVGRSVFPFAVKDHELVRFLDVLVYARRIDRKINIPPRSFLPMRDSFRRIVNAKPIAGLVKCFDMRTNLEEQRLAAWLLGKCGNREVVPLLVEHGKRGPEELRRTVVKALERLDARRESQKVANFTEDPRTRRLARLVSRDFGQILKKWHIPSEAEVPVPARPLELFVEIGPDAPVRPKTRDFIRRILERIRFLLRGAM